MFVGTEVGIVEHTVGIEDAHHRHLGKIKTFADHLCAHQHIGAAYREIADDPLVGITAASGVEVHARHFGIGEEVHHLVFDLLRAITTTTQVATATAGAHLGYAVSGSTIVATEHAQVSVQRQRHIAMIAMGHPSAGVALYHRGKASAVLKQQHLPAAVQRLSHGGKQLGRKHAFHHLPALQILDIHHLYGRQLHVVVARGKGRQSVFALTGIVIAFYRGGGRT